MVLGASPKAERFSNQAVGLLKERGYTVIPVHATAARIEGLPVIKDLHAIRDKVFTLSVYLGPKRSAMLADAMIALRPARVVLNPGTESPALAGRLKEAGIEVVEDCTLRMLREERF